MSVSFNQKKKGLNYIDSSTICDLKEFVSAVKNVEERPFRILLFTSSVEDNVCMGISYRNLQDFRKLQDQRSVNAIWESLYQLQIDIRNLKVQNKTTLISLINGTVADAGLAIILNSLHIIATKKTKVVFRETTIGLFPSLGLCRDLSNLLNLGSALGIYLTMTGRILEGREV